MKEKNLSRSHTIWYLLDVFVCTTFLFHLLFLFRIFCLIALRFVVFVDHHHYFKSFTLCFFPSFFHWADASFIISRWYKHTVYAWFCTYSVCNVHHCYHFFSVEHMCVSLIPPREETSLLQQITFIYNLLVIFT